MDKKILLSIGVAVLLGALCGIVLWYGYLEKQQATQTIDSVFASYSPRTTGVADSKIDDVRHREDAQNGKTGEGNTQRNEKNEASHISQKQITDSPVGAGAIITGEEIQYIDRAKGYVFKTNARSGKTERISNVTIPQAFAVHFAGNDTYVVESFDENKGIVGHILTTTKNNAGTDTVLPYSILSIVVDSNHDTIYALIRAEEGGSDLLRITLPFDATQTPEALWTSPLTAWSLHATNNNNQLYLETKPSNGMPGYAYTIDTAQKKLKKIIGDIPGFQGKLSPKGTYLLYTSTNDSHAATYIRSSTKTTQLPQVTFPDKCAWKSDESSLLCAFPKALPLSEMPDIWMQGRFSSSDTFAYVDPVTGTITPLEITLPGPVDTLDVQLSESALIFTNKRDGTLWTIQHI